MEDDATDLAAGQLRKSDFLDQLHAVVHAEAEAVLAGTGHSTDGCPYLSFWFGFYHSQSSNHIQRALHHYAPPARRARSASEYIPLVATHVRQAVEHWLRTGEVTGVPEGAPRPAAVQAAAARTGMAAASPVQLKARDGGGRRSDAPATVQAELGTGRLLENRVRSRMETAFGRSFSKVRLHTDATARRLSSEQNARAFTVGDHVAFGTGEYQPGTLVGDALIAHELAHTVQQQGGRSSSARTSWARDTGYDRLETDADRAAAGALAALHGGTRRTRVRLLGAPTPAGSAPRLSSGLRLSRCGTASTASAQAPATRPARGTPATPSGTPCPTSVRVGALVHRSHSDLSSSEREQYGTYLGAMSRMDVGPGPDHSGHCMKERLTTVTNACPAAVYTRDGQTTQPCTGDKCLGINRPFTAWGLSDGPTSFLDMHRTTHATSLLEGTGINSCRVVCEQAYTCDRVHPTTGVFLITRSFQADTYTRPDGTRRHITTGTVTKTERSGSAP